MKNQPTFFDRLGNRAVYRGRVINLLCEGIMLSIETKQVDTDERDYLTESIDYLNSVFTTPESMEQRAGVHLMDYCTKIDKGVVSETNGNFLLDFTKGY